MYLALNTLVKRAGFIKCSYAIEKHSVVHLISFSDRKPSNRTAIIGRELGAPMGGFISGFQRFWIYFVAEFLFLSSLRNSPKLQDF